VIFYEQHDVGFKLASRPHSHGSEVSQKENLGVIVLVVSIPTMHKGGPWRIRKLLFGVVTGKSCCQLIVVRGVLLGVVSDYGDCRAHGKIGFLAVN
jgi:hypothetical protein